MRSPARGPVFVVMDDDSWVEVDEEALHESRTSANRKGIAAGVAPRIS